MNDFSISIRCVYFLIIREKRRKNNNPSVCSFSHTNKKTTTFLFFFSRMYDYISPHIYNSLSLSPLIQGVRHPAGCPDGEVALFRHRKKYTHETVENKVVRLASFIFRKRNKNEWRGVRQCHYKVKTGKSIISRDSRWNKERKRPHRKSVWNFPKKNFFALLTKLLMPFIYFLFCVGVVIIEIFVSPPPLYFSRSGDGRWRASFSSEKM